MPGGREARRALPNFVALAVDRVPIALRALPSELAISEEALRDVTFIWISGRTRFQFTAAQRLVLRNYLLNGGMLIADAICGKEDFAAAFRQELIQILPNQSLSQCPRIIQRSLHSLVALIFIKSRLAHRREGWWTANPTSQRGAENRVY